VYVFVEPKIDSPWAQTVRLVAMVLWFGVEFFSIWKNTRYRSWWFVLYVLIFLIAAVLFGISAPVADNSQPTAIATNSVVINPIFWIMIALFALLSVYAIGIITAEEVVEKGALSGVTRLVLQ
jgi:membrane protease YdiL (CAAX protease family)